MSVRRAFVFNRFRTIPPDLACSDVFVESIVIERSQLVTSWY
tara:strand:+ start:759 stop:884 length:126 start_codon:yes stop_codon:yes gene_type:complete